MHQGIEHKNLELLFKLSEWMHK